MHSSILWSASLAVALSTWACGASAPQPDNEAKLAITVAPLDLEGINGATYAVTVRNGAGDVVWSESSLDSAQFGSPAGDLTYIGTCDATSNPHAVTLQLISLSQNGIPLPPDGWRDPGPITKNDVACVANGDTPVNFDLTIMRPANGGFFDIAVEFDSIHCSAKLDCVDALLHRPNNGGRSDTAVVGFQCAAGDDRPTTLYWGDARIACYEDAEYTVLISSYPIDPAAGPGQHGPIGTEGQASPGVYEHAFYRGDNVAAGEGNSCFYNMALGLDADHLGANCVFEATATAAAETWSDFRSPTGSVYPVVTWSVPLTDGAGALSCGENPLDGVGSGVVTSYSSTDGAPFEIAAPCGGGIDVAGIACGGRVDGGEVTLRSLGDGTVVAQLGDLSAGPFALPSGAALASECCVDPCCETEVPQ